MGADREIRPGPGGAVSDLPRDPTAGSMSGTLDTPVLAETRLYRANRGLLTEHTLLGSLIHVPDGLNDMGKFLEWRDFSSPEARAVYLTVRGLAQAGELTEVLATTDRATQRRACNENRNKVFDALNHARFINQPLPDAAAVVNRLVAAAPAETLPYRGVYDPSAQMRLARDVLASAIRRRVTGLGVLMQRRTPLVRPLPTAGRQELAALSLGSNLEAVQANLDRMTVRWGHAVDRAGTNSGIGAATEAAAAAGAERRPRKLGPISAFLARRAERHLIHLAVHSGHHLDGSIRPEHFTTPEHRNTWQLLMDIRDRREPVNHVALYNEKHRDPTIGPVLSDEDIIIKMREAPDTRPNRIANSLRTVIHTTLNRAAKDAGTAVTAAATNRAVPVEGLLDYADQQVHRLMGRATTARAAHQTITEQHDTGRSRTR